MWLTTHTLWAMSDELWLVTAKVQNLVMRRIVSGTGKAKKPYDGFPDVIIRWFEMRKLKVRYAPLRRKAGYGGKNANRGFTLLETLLAVAILVILMGLAMVGAARYRDHLKIAELDNAARDIYMAAENRAVLLQNSGRLGTASATLLSGTESGDLTQLTLTSDGTTKYFRVLSEGTAPDKLDALLPAGVIDPALRERNFRVVYDEATGHVVEAFYSEGAIGADLDDYRASRSDRVSNKRMVGWYKSEAADEIGTRPLPTPGVEVIIVNGEELTLTVKYTMPADGLPAGGVKRTPGVTLKYGGEEVGLLKLDGAGHIDPLNDPRRTNSGDITADNSATYTWVLDSLDTLKQFKYLKSGLTGLTDLGGDFTVTASLTLTADGYIDSAYYATGTDNSLFAKDSTYNPADGTAQIANLRHLQNLHPGHSNVGIGTVKAEQLCDIDCTASRDNEGNTLDANYKFIPIVNNKLTSYNGQGKHIYNLSTITTANAGLFGTVDLNLAIDNCRVCWKDADTGKLVTDAPKAIDYKVSGSTNAGGLIGSVSGGNITITNSFAATTVKGTTNAGGLIGSVSGSAAVTIENSYADCYLNGFKAGGLVGSGNVKNLENCYAAGFSLAAADKTAGLVNGNVTATASKTYSVVRVIKKGAGGNITSELEKPGTPLYGSKGEPTTGSVRYLYKKDDVDAAVKTALGSAFEFVENKPETHAYDLRHKLDNSVDSLPDKYIFPGLDGLPHYCDWAELDQAVAGLAYYEVYKYEDAPGVYGPGLNDTLKKDTDNPTVIKDGYALVFVQGAEPSDSYPVKYGNSGTAQDWTLKKEAASWKWSASTGGTGQSIEEGETYTITQVTGADTKIYTLIPLPDEVVTGDLPSESFYQLLEGGTGADAKGYYFNPHFAKTVQGAAKNTGGSFSAAPEVPEVIVRTARHFYDLSVFQTGSCNYAVKGFSFKQELDIDYKTYTGYRGTFMPPEDGLLQGPIGKSGTGVAFTGTYDGGCHIIKNIFFKSADNAGLFGYSSGMLKNIVYELDSETTGAVNSATNVGALLGSNGGTVDNCAVFGVSMKVNADNVGGLVGQNGGTVTSCAAEVACLTANKADSHAGGLVGQNASGKTVSSSYAVGKVSGDSGTIAGLIGDNGGKVENSYAAVYLHSGTGATATNLGLCGGTVTDSRWLSGIFRYRGERYEAAYTGSNGITIEELMDLVAEEGSGNKWKDTDWGETGQSIHYGISGKDWKPDYACEIQTTSGGTTTTQTVYDLFPYLTGVKGLKREGHINPAIKTNETVQSHYGLWPVISAGLTYYERKTNTTQCYVEGFRPAELSTDPAISTLGGYDYKAIDMDGYALVFGQKNIPANYRIKYEDQIWTLKRTGTSEYKWTFVKNDGTEECGGTVTALEAEYTEPSGTKRNYTIVPLPEKVVTEKLADTGNFYQELDCGVNTYYFNPHFAKTVKATDTRPADPKNDEKDKTGLYVYIRTPRHLYSLSRFQNFQADKDNGWESLVYDEQSYYYLQELDLDYNEYKWYGKADFKPTNKGYYYEQPSITIERDVGTGIMDGAYNGHGHKIKNVFYKTPDKDLQYLGLFKYINYLYNVTYVVPDNITVALTKTLDGGTIDGTSDGIKVGTLAGGSFWPENCTAKIQNLTVTSANEDIYVGGLFGYANKATDCHSVIKGTLKVERNGIAGGSFTAVPLDVAAGGLTGVNYRNLINCTSKVNSMEVKGNDYCYVGGLTGRTTTNTGWEGIGNENFRALKNSTATVGSLKVEGTGEVYVGGLAGWGDNIYTCSAVVTGELTAKGAKVYAGGLAGGGSNVNDCSAIAATVKATATTSEGMSYAGGLLGVEKMGNHSQEAINAGTQWTIAEFPKLNVGNSYAAVAVLEGKTRDAFCGCIEDWHYDVVYKENDEEKHITANSTVGIKNCYFLNGNADSWHIGGTNSTGAASTIATDKVTGKSYDELKELAGTLGAEWGKLTGTDDYPFPVSTKKDGQWYYPGTDWPKIPAATAQAQSEPMALLLPEETKPGVEDESD